MQTIQKNTEKSELDRFYLFTVDNMEKAKLYIWCYRFLNGINNILAPGNTKNVVNTEVEYQQNLYYELSKLVNNISRTNIGKNRNTRRISQLVVEDKRVDEMIDAFALLLERQNILSMSRIKGIILDGPSGKEFQRVFNQKISETQNLAAEDEIVEDEPVEEVSEVSEKTDTTDTPDTEETDETEDEETNIDEEPEEAE